MNVVDVHGRRLFLWRAWSDEGRIIDCGYVWAEREIEAQAWAMISIAGGPHATDVARIETDAIGHSGKVELPRRLEGGR